MQTHQQAHSTAAIAVTPRREYLTVSQFNQRHKAFTVAALRSLIFKADARDTDLGEIPGNGLLEAGAIIRIGRRVLIDEARFFEWVDAKQQRGEKRD